MRSGFDSVLDREPVSVMVLIGVAAELIGWQQVVQIGFADVVKSLFYLLMVQWWDW